MFSRALDDLPAAVVFLGMAILMLVSFEIGYQFGSRIRTRQDKEAPVSLGPMVGGLLGMLGFALAFTFAMAAGQHDLRKMNVLDEANAVGTAYLRADLLPAEHRDAMRNLLRAYVEVRLDAAAGGDLDVALAQSLEIHEQLWAHVSAAAAEAPTTNTALAVESVNAVIDTHGKRVTAALRNRIPGSIWLALLAISALTMVTMGTQVGFTAKRRLIAVVPLAFAFAVLVTLVADLDHPQRGLITVNQQAMTDLETSMRGQSE